MSDTGLTELLSRMRSVAAGEGVNYLNLTRMEEIEGIGGDLAILQFSHPEVERLTRDSPVDPSYILPLSIRVKRGKEAPVLDADRFYRLAGDMDLPDDKKVQALMHEIDRLIDRIVEKV